MLLKLALQLPFWLIVELLLFFAGVLGNNAFLVVFLVLSPILALSLLGFIFHAPLPTPIARATGREESGR